MSIGSTGERAAPGLVIHQPARGFRYSAEAFWLAGMALEGGPVARVLDLGTGSGVVAALLARRGAQARGVDSRPEWERLWERTLAQSPALQGRLRLDRLDVLDLQHDPVDVVVCNPPFFAAGTGPTAPDPWRAAARTESTARLADFIRAGLGCLRLGGRMLLALPQDRLREAEAEGAQLGAYAKRVVCVDTRRGLVELVMGRDGATQRLAIERTDPLIAQWYASARDPLP